MIHTAHYRTVYTWEPWALYAGALLLLAVGAVLFVWGRRRAAAERASLRAAEESRDPATPRRRTLERDEWRRLRRWEVVRNAGAVTACMCLVLGFLGLHTQDRAHVNLRDNLRERYGSVLRAVDEVEETEGGYLVELHWERPGNHAEEGQGVYTAIVVPDVLVTLEDRRRPTAAEIPPEVLAEWPDVGR